MTPKVSILMGIYNCAPTLSESIDSILAQTFTDWEFILCDDGSTDDTLAIARGYAVQDPRIIILINEKNLGLAQTLDRCIAKARGEYLARQDGDDISERDRLAKLVRAMDVHPEMAIISSWMTSFDEKGVWGAVRTKEFPVASDFIQGTPFCHAPCIMRKAAILAVGGYGSQSWVLRAEDYFLWFRLYAAGYCGMNIQEPLYRMRDDRAARRRRTLSSRFNECRVRWVGYSLLKIPLLMRVYALRPIFVWMVPEWIYESMRRRRLKDKEKIK